MKTLFNMSTLDAPVVEFTKPFNVSKSLFREYKERLKKIGHKGEISCELFDVKSHRRLKQPQSDINLKYLVKDYVNALFFCPTIKKFGRGERDFMPSFSAGIDQIFGINSGKIITNENFTVNATGSNGNIFFGKETLFVVGSYFNLPQESKKLSDVYSTEIAKKFCNDIITYILNSKRDDDSVIFLNFGEILK